MIEASLRIDGQRVGAGMFDVLPRIGESVDVTIQVGAAGSRWISGRVIDVQHESDVRIDGDGKIAAVAKIELTLGDTTVELLEAACTSDA